MLSLTHDISIVIYMTQGFLVVANNRFKMFKYLQDILHQKTKRKQRAGSRSRNKDKK